VADEPVLLFDGTCNFCDRTVQFVLDHERDHALKFAALQSEAAKALLDRALGGERAGDFVRELTGADGDPTTIVLVEGDNAYTLSTAALQIARHLRAPWRWTAIFAIVPRFLRDACYRWFARHRYAWFGKTESCRVPTPELRARFL
jgi:predicted DCC family thiol-disulfide oxidoreductase YuxK